MRTIVHIGQHKTGTTSLQHYLQNNRRELEKKGLYVPSSLVEITNPSHYLLNIYSLDDKRLSSMKETLLKTKPLIFFTNLEVNLKKDIAQHYKRAEEKKCTDIIWTNEGLYLLDSTKEYQKLASLFTKYSKDIECICCFREKNSFRKSYSQQLTKQGLQYDNVIDSYKNVEPNSWLFDYKKKKKLLKSVFKQTSFIPYDPKDMVNTFMVSIGYHPVSIKSTRLNITK